MQNLTERYKESNINPNLEFLINEYDEWRVMVLQGGARSGKTISTIDFFIYLIENYRGLTISIVRETLPSLKASVLRDFEDRMNHFGLWTNYHFNKTELEYRHNGNLVEFFSVDNEQKMRGRKRDILYGNEANEITKPKMMQLLMRTTGFVILDFNPSMPHHYIYDDIMTREDCSHIITTYKDNPFLAEEIIREIELLQQTDPMAWKVYGCGERGEDRAGLIYPMWAKATEIPAHLPYWYGLDWGFANDPTAIVRISYDKNKKILYNQEVVYQKGLMNSDIARIIKQDIWEREVQHDCGVITKNSAIHYNGELIQLKDYIENPNIFTDMLKDAKEAKEVINSVNSVAKYFVPIYCDSAEPKSIGELRQYGISAYPALKGTGSVKSQIYFLYNYRVLYQGDNIDKERMSYRWKENKEKEFENVPIDANNHAMDALRYGAYTHIVKQGL